jgi:hypothetical protein
MGEGVKRAEETEVKKETVSILQPFPKKIFGEFRTLGK